LREQVSRSQRREEFESTALPLSRSLYATALRLTGQADDAMDVLQETFLRAYRTFDSFTLGTNAKAWLFKILRSVSANRRRDRHRRPPVLSLEETEERFGPLALAAPPTREPDHEEVGHALNRLPEEHRLVVQLVDVEGLTYEEAADVLACPVGTVRSRLSRARRALFVELHDYAERNGYARGPS
jgi:RNA polymerase sigma-70 factor, ECF subfamily